MTTITRKRTKSPRKTIPRKHGTSGTKLRKRATAASISSKKTPHVKASHMEVIGETFVFECTHPGCGYKLWHDEKHSPGQVRLDWKCPKCHHYGFKCLGKSEVPEKFEIPTTDLLDINRVNASELGNPF